MSHMAGGLPSASSVSARRQGSRVSEELEIHFSQGNGISFRNGRTKPSKLVKEGNRTREESQAGGGHAGLACGLPLPAGVTR